MRRNKVKTVILYYNSIPNMIKLLEQERRELENEYNGLRGMSFDAAPHSSMPGKPTEALAIKAETNNTWGQIQSKVVKTQVLQTDAAIIRDCMDALNGKYKSIVHMRDMEKYSWARIASKIGVPDSTARRWYDRAIERLGEALDSAPMAEEIFDRASRARV